MQIKIKRITQCGFTLIEALSSIVLLSVVILFFLSFFTQSTLFSNKTEDKLTAINISEKVLNEAKMGMIPNSIETVNGKDYYIEIDYKDEDDLQLTRIHVKVYTSAKTVSQSPHVEVFGYRTKGGNK